MTAASVARPGVPLLSKLGAVVIAVGLAFDLVEHTLVPHLHEAVVGGFPVGEHAAHLVVLIGMVTVLAGIVADGARTARRLGRQEAGRLGRQEAGRFGRHHTRRPGRQEGSPRDAVR